jgi:hypothetical protein
MYVRVGMSRLSAIDADPSIRKYLVSWRVYVCIYVCMYYVYVALHTSFMYA